MTSNHTLDHIIGELLDDGLLFLQGQPTQFGAKGMRHTAGRKAPINAFGSIGTVESPLMERRPQLNGGQRPLVRRDAAIGKLVPSLPEIIVRAHETRSELRRTEENRVGQDWVS